MKLDVFTAPPESGGRASTNRAARAVELDEPVGVSSHQRGTESSNPSSSSGESDANLVAAEGVARGWDSEFESALLQRGVIQTRSSRRISLARPSGWNANGIEMPAPNEVAQRQRHDDGEKRR